MFRTENESRTDFQVLSSKEGTSVSASVALKSPLPAWYLPVAICSKVVAQKTPQLISFFFSFFFPEEINYSFIDDQAVPVNLSSRGVGITSHDCELVPSIASTLLTCLTRQDLLT